MASGYALPSSAGSYHAHSHSYSTLLPPSRQSHNAFAAKSNGHVRKAPSTGGLYTHAEASRETTPSPNAAVEQPHYPFPPAHNHQHAQGHNVAAFEQNGHIHNHHHGHGHGRSQSFSPMKSSRPRGESDLGRPAAYRGTEYKPTLDSIPTASTSWFSLPEALTALLIPTPYLLASAAYSSTFRSSLETFPPLPAYDQGGQDNTIVDGSIQAAPTPSGFIESCTLTASTLLLVGVLAKLRSPDRITDRRKDSTGLSLSALKAPSAWETMGLRALSLGLPFYASMLLGGMRTGLVLLIAVAANLTCTDWKTSFALQELKQVWSSKVATTGVIILSFISDELGLTIRTSLGDLIMGYLALGVSVLLLQPPLPLLAGVSSTSGSKMTSPTSRTMSGTFRLSAASPLTCSAGDINLTLFAGVFMAIVSVLASIILSAAPPVSIGTVILGTLAIGTMSASILFSQPATLRGESKAGLALGCFISASCSFMFSPTLWPGTMCNGGLAALSFLGVLYDTNVSSSSHGHHHHHHEHDGHAHDHAGHSHHHHHHHHQHQHSEAGSSALTKFIMARCEPGSLVYSILSEKDSRRIAYFTT